MMCDILSQGTYQNYLTVKYENIILIYLVLFPQDNFYFLTRFLISS